MVEPYPTKGGRMTRGEAYAKLIHHLREASELCAMMSHLHRTEDSIKDQAMANGWLVASENIQRMEQTLTLLAQGRRH